MIYVFTTNLKSNNNILVWITVRLVALKLINRTLEKNTYKMGLNCNGLKLHWAKFVRVKYKP